VVDIKVGPGFRPAFLRPSGQPDALLASAEAEILRGNRDDRNGIDDIFDTANISVINVTTVTL